MDAKTYPQGLPPFAEMDKYFEVSSLEEESFPVREVRRKVVEVLSLYVKFLEELLHPDSSAAMHEVSQFTDEEREKVLLLYRKLKKFERMGAAVALTFDDAKQVAFVSDVFTSWKGLVSELQGITTKLVSAWDVKVSSKKDNGYFG